MRTFIFSILTLLALAVAPAQTDTSAVKKTSPFAGRMHLRLGYDIGKKIWSHYRHGNIDQAYLNLGYGNHIFELTAGTETMPYTHPTFSLVSEGRYWKAGYHYNFYDNWGDMHNEITLGIRYARAAFDYRLDQIHIDYPAPYDHWSYTRNGSVRFDRLHAWWLELTTAVRAELFHNLYLDLYVSGKWMPRTPQAGDMTAVYVPGFYRTNVSHFGFGLGYALSYRFGF
ncbi:MAG: hypothetical protein GXO24_05875 [Chlorobi bacterium]|nr:hypothetical protein [Chlorobiota bacterium]